MKKLSRNSDDASNQLSLELISQASESACGTSRLATAATPRPIWSAGVVDIVSARQRRAAESDRALLRAIQTRAAHLTDCLFKHQ